MTTDLDITKCRICGKDIVIGMEDLDFPMCMRLECFRQAFPDDYKELMKEIEEIKKERRVKKNESS